MTTSSRPRSTTTPRTLPPESPSTRSASRVDSRSSRQPPHRAAARAVAGRFDLGRCLRRRHRAASRRRAGPDLASLSTTMKGWDGAKPAPGSNGRSNSPPPPQPRERLLEGPGTGRAAVDPLEALAASYAAPSADAAAAAHVGAGAAVRSDGLVWLEHARPRARQRAARTSCTSRSVAQLPPSSPPSSSSR